MSYLIREIEEPKFKFWQALVLASLFLLLLYLLADRSHSLFALSEDEIAAMKAQKDELSRDMTFRFIDTPEEERESEADVFSDADRVAKSQELPETQVDNSDPVSQGDSYELVQNTPSVAAKESAQVLPQKESSEAKPSEPLAKDEPEPLDPADDPIFQLENGPKPYRPPTSDELAKSQKKAEKQLERDANKASSAAPSLRSYDNDSGRRTPQIGFNIDTGGHDLGPYLKKLVELVKSNWRIPEIARLEAGGIVVVYFELHQNGMIEQTTVIQNSDFEPLDTSSYNAVRNVYQAPPLPSHIEEPWIPIKFSFYYNVRPPI